MNTLNNTNEKCCEKCFGRQGTSAGGGIYCLVERVGCCHQKDTTGWEPLDPYNINPGDAHARLSNAIGTVYAAGYNPNEENDGFAAAREEVFAAANDLITQEREKAEQRGRDEAVDFIEMRVLAFMEMEISDTDGQYDKAKGYIEDATTEQWEALLDEARTPERKGEGNGL